MSLSTIIRVQAFLNRAGIHKADGPFDDRQILTWCPHCGDPQTLDQAPVRLEGGRTRYRCKNGCGDIVTIAELDPAGNEVGCRLDGLVFWNAADVLLAVRGNLVRIPPADTFSPADSGSTDPGQNSMTR